MNFLIITIPDDTHALYVHLALERLGHQSKLWYPADFPTQQMHTFSLKNKTVFWQSHGTEFVINNKDYFDVVWCRRVRKPVLPHTLHPADRRSALKENMALFYTFFSIIAPQAKWINPFQESVAASCKLQQLTTALNVGFDVPPTIVSNDPSKIKNFIQNNPTGETIYKPLTAPIWLEEKKIRLTYTTTIDLENLPLDSTLQNTPGIFQQKIVKLFELRITVMGQNIIATKIHSQKHPDATIDWRAAPTHELEIEHFTLPPKIMARCHAFMHKMGLVFGCFDFIVTPNEEYYFLEINEQGQFLWIEDVNPTIKMLEPFVDFLTEMRRSKSKTQNDIVMTAFTAKVQKQAASALQLHRQPEIY